MIDILLVNPTTIRTYKKMSADVLSMPPLGLLYVGTYLKQAGFIVELLDFSVEFLTLDDFKKQLLTKRPKIVGISTFTECYTPSKILIDLIKNLLPETKIVAGGPAATFSFNKFFNETAIDYIVKGEGEFAFKELTDCILNNRLDDVSKIKGIAYRMGNDIIHTLKNERIKDLNNLCWPDRDLIDQSKYQYPFTISTSRGCPGDCIFCSSRQYWGKEIYLRSPENIVDEIKFLKEKYNLKQFFFVDDTFTMIPKRAIKTAKMLLDNNISLTWGCESRADVVDYDLLKALYEAGCRKIQFGLESANNEVLKKIGKKITKEQVLNAVTLATSIGLDINVSFIIGHPFDTHETIRETLEFALLLFRNYKINPYCAINIPYPGTSIYDTPEKYNVKILTDNFDNYTMENAIIETDNFKPHDLRKYFQSFQDVLLGKDEKLFYQ